MIRFSPAIGLMKRALIRYMDAECFPEDVPFEWKDANFTIGEYTTDSECAPACYCAWKPVDFQGGTVAFLYRAGVMPEFRGKGLQSAMIKLREAEIRPQYKIVVTCTALYNMASITSLQNAGYKIYYPGERSGLPDVSHDIPSIHWYKNLSS